MRMMSFSLAAVCGIASLACAQEKQPATIRIQLPDGGVKKPEVRVDGKVVKSTGLECIFTSSPLESGKTFAYKVEALIIPNSYTRITRSREVTVKAGDDIKLDLRTEDKAHPDKIVVPWVPTPDEVVDRMAELARVTKDDIIYDPGCGDAVMLIRPMKKHGAKKGIGIDIDPMMVKVAREKAKEEGVADKVEIRQGDILNTEDMKDISEATVVLLYIGEDLGKKLSPILLTKCKPGTRIVSHRFLLGDWKPDRTIEVTAEDGHKYTLHTWVVPQDPADAKKLK